MRALNATGYINSRLRMITAFFLVKVLFVDWRLGEKYFATKLVDYDRLSLERVFNILYDGLRYSLASLTSFALGTSASPIASSL